MKALEIENLSLSFGSFPVIKDLNFSVDEGEFVTLLGPSGCGKTSLLKTIGGFYEPDRGRVLIHGADVTRLPPESRDTTMCFQSYALFPHLTVAENIVFGLKEAKLAKAARNQRLEEVSRQVDLGSQLRKLPTALSGGQQQRVALARALAMRSRIILFDEPLSNLDAKLRDQVRIEILRLQREHGFTALYVTHDQSEALAMSDTVIILQDGKIAQMGSPEEIYTRPSTRFVADFVGTANILEGKVLGRLGNERYHVRTPMGDLLVDSPAEPASEKVYLCWRPEDAVIQESPGRENSFSSSLSVSIYQGGRRDLILQDADSFGPEYRLQAPRSFHQSPGSLVHFLIPPAALRFLEALS